MQQCGASSSEGLQGGVVAVASVPGECTCPCPWGRCFQQPEPWEVLLSFPRGMSTGSGGSAPHLSSGQLECWAVLSCTAGSLSCHLGQPGRLCLSWLGPSGRAVGSGPGCVGSLCWAQRHLLSCLLSSLVHAGLSCPDRLRGGVRPLPPPAPVRCPAGVGTWDPPGHRQWGSSR